MADGMSLGARTSTRPTSELRAIAARDELLVGMRALGSRTAAIDPREGEDDTSRLEAQARELQLLLAQAMDTLGALRRTDEESRTAEGTGEFDLLVDDALDEGSTARAPVLSPPRLANVCFAGKFELGRVLRELGCARQPPETLVAVETARRKLLRVFRAVLDATDDARDDEPPWRYESTDLRSALVVRRLYAEFRRTLRRPTADDADAVLSAIRYAAGALATLVASSAYAEARASDRALLRRLHARALTWARTDRSVTGGLQLLDDVWTSADLLRDINRRQELRAHDAMALRVASDGPADDPAAWRARLDDLVGLDDTLDAAILRVADATDLESLARHIAERAAQLR